MANGSQKFKANPDMIPDVGFNLKSLEQFANDKGILFEHWAALPSPIGKKNQEEYRRPDSLDTISEGAFIYKKIGEFRCTMVGNSHSNSYKPTDGGLYDYSSARIIIPKYYATTCDGSKQKEISLLPGDRIYAKDIEVKVANYQENHFNPTGVDIVQFPISCVDFLEDSKGRSYNSGKDFTIDKNGNIKWLAKGKNPGVDPETGRGRVYSIRYKYLAFWYISELINEVRVTNTDEGTAARLPYHAVVQREYIYHNKNRGDAKDSNLENHTNRTKEDPESRTADLNEFQVKVDVRDFE